MFLFIKIRGEGTDRQSPLRIISDAQYFRVEDATRSKEIYLRKRNAYPRTFCRQIDEHTFELGYGKVTANHHDEFLKIVARSDGSVIIERDAYCVLPLFYAYQSGMLVVSNQYTGVLDALYVVRVSKMGVQDLLAPFSHYACPPVEEIKVLGERQKLTLNSKGLNLTLPPPRQWLISDDASPADPKEFRSRLEEAFHYFIATRLKGERYVCEVSGGLDSATLPLFLRQTYGDSAVPLLTALLFPGQFAKTQHSKIARLASLTNATVISEPLTHDADFPLGHMVAGDNYEPFYIEHPLKNAYARQMAQLRQAGVDVLCTGIGGDELFENITDEAETLICGEAETRRRRQDELAPFLTQRFYDEYLALVPRTPVWSVPLHARSMLGAQTAQSNLYIEQGIWPVSPFADPSLYAFCQGLPPHFRANKNMLRMYHAAYRNPEMIYNPSQNETFGDLYKMAFRDGKYDKLFQLLAAQSVTRAMDYVDLERVSDMYQQYREGDGPEDDYRFLYMWLTAEINLQFTPKLALS